MMGGGGRVANQFTGAMDFVWDFGRWGGRCGRCLRRQTEFIEFWSVDAHVRIFLSRVVLVDMFFNRKIRGQDQKISKIRGHKIRGQRLSRETSCGEAGVG
jgi:hypothetical protein